MFLSCHLGGMGQRDETGATGGASRLGQGNEGSESQR